MRPDGRHTVRTQESSYEVFKYFPSCVTSFLFTTYTLRINCVLIVRVQFSLPWQIRPSFGSAAIICICQGLRFYSVGSIHVYIELITNCIKFIQSLMCWSVLLVYLFTNPIVLLFSVLRSINCWKLFHICIYLWIYALLLGSFHAWVHITLEYKNDKKKHNLFRST